MNREVRQIQIGQWEINVDSGWIRYNGDSEVIHPRPKLMDILSLLVKAEGDLVTRNEILQSAWPETTARDESLTRAIADLRRLLDDESSENSLIITVPKRGYRLCMPAHERVESGISNGNSLNPPDKRYSIAVLPFTSRGSNQHYRLLADGISEEIIEVLTGTPDLRVISRSSAFRFKGNEETEEITRQLKVSLILRGSLTVAQGYLTLNLEMVDTRSGEIDWVDSVSCDLGQVTALKEKVAISLADHLGISPPSALSSEREPDPRAYVLMLQGRHLGNLLTAEGWKQSTDHYQRALAIDPDYAVVWAGLARNYAWEARYGVGSPFEEGFTLARAAINRAIQIDPENSFSLAMAGWLHLYDEFDLQSASRSFQAALDFQPENTETLFEVTNLARALGKLRLATDICRFVASRDPVNPAAHRNLGICMRLRGNLDEAIQAFETALRLSPDLTSGNALLGFVLLEKNQPVMALEAMMRETSVAWRQVGLSIVYHSLEMHTESQRALEEMIDRSEQRSALNAAYIEAFRGNSDRSFFWLKRALEFRDPGILNVANERLFFPLHDDERWPKLLAETGQVPDRLREIEFTVDLPKA